MKDGSVLAAPARVLGTPSRGPIVRVVGRGGLAIPELWTGSGWTTGGAEGMLGEMFPGRSFELTADQLDAEGIPREDAEGPEVT